MFEKYLTEDRNMVLCLVCDLSSVASESMGEECFKEKTIVLNVFPVSTHATEKSHSEYPGAKESIQNPMRPRKNFEGL